MTTPQKHNSDNRKVAIYVRPAVVQEHQSISQKEILLTYAHSMGWTDEQITVFEEQPGLTALFESIQQDSIRTLIVTDHLFRDRASREGSLFIRLCETFGVTVITPHNTYDFSNDADVARFRFQSEQAAEYLQVALDHLQKNRDWAAKQGLYDGRPVLPGYIVDRQRVINGKNNPTYKKLIVYEPHTAIIRHLFCQYVACQGDIEELVTQLPTVPVPFPDFDEHVDPRTPAKTTLEKTLVGYALSLLALKRIVSHPNPVCISALGSTKTWREQITTKPLFQRTFSEKHKNFLPEESARIARNTPE